MWFNQFGMMGYGWGWLVIIGLLVVVILAITVLIRYLQRPVQQPERFINKSALEILDERYAKGEIDDEEYRAKKSELIK